MLKHESNINIVSLYNGLREKKYFTVLFVLIL